MRRPRNMAWAAVLGLLFSQDAFAAYTGPLPYGVTAGSTGAATFTAHGILFGEGTSPIGVSGIGAAGIPFIGQGGSADPVFGTAVVGGGGTGATTFTTHGVILGEGTSALVATGTGASGIPLIGQGASLDPIFGTATVPGGGTGATTFAAHGVILGEAASALAATAAGASGIPLIGQGGSADPIFGTAVVGGGGTGATTLTAHGVLLGEGTSAITPTAVGTNGQMLLGATAADPGWQTMSGDATLGTTGVLTLANTAVTPGSYTNTNLTVDSKGRITAASNGSGGGGGSLTTETKTGTSPITVATTNGITSIISMGTPAASTINIPTAVQTAGWRQCVKDGTTNFAAFPATITPAAGTIDGATTVVANQGHQEICFISDGTNWFTE